MNFKCRICGTEFEEKPPADCPVCRQTDFRDLRKQATEREIATAELGGGVSADQAAPDRKTDLDQAASSSAPAPPDQELILDRSAAGRVRVRAETDENDETTKTPRTRRPADPRRRPRRGDLGTRRRR